MAARKTIQLRYARVHFADGVWHDPGEEFAAAAKDAHELVEQKIAAYVDPADAPSEDADASDAGDEQPDA